MPKYVVKVRYSGEISYSVKATSAEEAERKAIERYVETSDDTDEILAGIDEYYAEKITEV